MTIPTKAPVFAPAPPEYDQRTFAQWKQQLDLYVQMLNNRGPVVASKITLTDLPTSSVGLSSGSLWNDSNTVKIVP